MDLIILDEDTYPEAKCLDGSQAGFYWQEGYGDGADKFIVYFEGGGACLGPTYSVMMTSCYQRSFTDLGSSKNWDQQWNGAGVVQDSEQNNPEFYNWNKVYIKYCGGTAHQGYQKDPIKWLGRDLYIRGLSGTMAILDYISVNFKFTSTEITEVLLSGESAGGLGTFYFADIVQDMLPDSTRYWAAPDSGFFINYYENSDNNFMLLCINQLLDVTDKELVVPAGCPYINDPERMHECVLPQYFAQNIKSDLYIIMSEYDEFNTSAFVGIECVKHGSMQDCGEKQKETMQNFRKLMIADVENVLAQKENANAWLVACIRHGFFASSSVYNGDKYEVPMHSGNTPQAALYEWMYQTPAQRQNLIDNVEWPLNLPCNGYEIKAILE